MVSKSKFSTGDPERALPVLGEFFPKVKMRNPRDEFAFEIEHGGDDLLSLVHFHLRSPGSTSAVDMTGTLTLGEVNTGELDLSAGRDRIDTSEPFIYPNREVEGNWDEVTMTALTVSIPETLRFARALVGDDRFRLEIRGSSPIDRASGEQWSALVSYTRASLADSSPLLGSEIVRTNAFSHLLSVMLATFPNNAMEAGGSRVFSGVVPGAVRRAVLFMDDNAHRAITVADIAEEARMSIRGLQYAFRSALDTTPLAYLRRVRLARAHADLAAADPSRGDTVREIAQSWGFVHLGRFAEQYRLAYGESPRRTLES